MPKGSKIPDQSDFAQLALRQQETQERRANRISLGVVGIDAYSADDLVDEVLEHALHGRETRQIVTVNAQFYVLAEKDRRFRECLNKADYICADGKPVSWACGTFTGEHVPRITGVDLIDMLCSRGAASGLRAFFLGGRPSTATETARVLCERYPGLQVAGVSCPEWGFEKSKDTLQPVLDQIALARPHVVFVGLGAPKQEFLIEEHLKALHVPIAIGIGGSFEILSGLLQRAPQWMQSSGLEWAFRLFQEPGRLWKRYLIGNLEFIWFLSKWRLRVNPNRGLVS